MVKSVVKAVVASCVLIWGHFEIDSVKLSITDRVIWKIRLPGSLIDEPGLFLSSNFLIRGLRLSR